ncbi:MAG: type VI secretion system baseplate subunit TssE [Archangium sp.]|nr:type VI secretion system baseplate subunit TssE [Archangium sp.]
MATRGLLSRISTKEPARRSDVVESVLKHLQSLLNMRTGSAATVPGMGVPDFTDLVHDFPGSSMTLTQAIRATILAYEPRLKNVMVRHVPDDTPLVVRFEVSAQLVNEKNTTIKFRTEFAPGGRINVWSAGLR